MRSLEASVIELLRLWADEMPTATHRHEVFFGRPDTGRETLVAERSTAVQLTGGSLLGAPAYSGPMRHLLEDLHPHREEPAVYDGSLTVEKHLVTPLRSALRRCGKHFESYLTDVARAGGDWLGSAQRRGCYDEHFARTYANEAFRRLWREFQVERPARIPRHERRRNQSDDVPWIDKSEAQQVAESAA